MKVKKSKKGIKKNKFHDFQTALILDNCAGKLTAKEREQYISFLFADFLIYCKQ